MATLTLDTMISRSPDLMVSQVGEEIMMMDIQKGMYYALNPVSARVWTLLDPACTVKALCDHLLAEYEVEPERCAREIIQVLSTMLERDMITVDRLKTVAPSTPCGGS